MVKVEVKTAEQRLEVAGQRTMEKIRVERNRITAAHNHLGKLFACTTQLEVQHDMACGWPTLTASFFIYHCFLIEYARKRKTVY